MKVKSQKLRAFFLKNKNSSLSLLMWGGLFFVLGCALVLGYFGGYDRKEETKQPEKVAEVKQSRSTSNTPKKVETPKPKEKETNEDQPKVETSEPVLQPVSEIPQEPQTYTAHYGAYTGVSSVSYDEAYQEAEQAFDEAEKARIEQEEQANRQVAEELKESILQQDPNAVVNIIQ